jgi:hypothetical protein
MMLLLAQLQWLFQFSTKLLPNALVIALEASTPQLSWKIAQTTVISTSQNVNAMRVMGCPIAHSRSLKRHTMICHLIEVNGCYYQQKD